MKYLELDGSDRIVGETNQAPDLAARKLPPGHSVVPAEGRRPPARPRRLLDYAGHRRSAYSELDGAQADAIMKVLASLLAKPTGRALVEAEILAEFEAIVAKRAAIKAANPKPST
jgi:hypothetical protein